MAEFQLETTAEDIARSLLNAARAVAQLEPVNQLAARLFDDASDAPGRVVRADASANGVVVAAAWRSPTVTVARPWFVAQLNANQAAIVDLYLQHATAVVADIQG
jgi:hypothetical protein